MDLSTYAVIFEERAKVAKVCGCNFRTVGYMKVIMDETTELLGETVSGDYLDIELGSNELAHEQFLALLFIK